MLTLLTDGASGADFLGKQYSTFCVHFVLCVSLLNKKLNKKSSDFMFLL